MANIEQPVVKLIEALAQIERLAREADPKLVDVPAMLGDIARKATADYGQSLAQSNSLLTMKQTGRPGIPYTVGAVRAAGLQARWTRTRRGGPILSAFRPEHNAWYVIDGRQYERAKVVGYKQAFEEATALGKFFSISV